MDISSKLVQLDSINNEVKSHLESFPSYVDSFYEDHLVESEFFQLLIADEAAAIVAIHKEHLMILFMVHTPFRRFSQQLFQYAKKLRSVFSAYVPTADELYLSHAYEVARNVEPQAYFFKQEGLSLDHDPDDLDFELKLALLEDQEMILEDTDDFFDNLENHLLNKRIFIGRMKKQVVSYGIIEESRVMDRVASIGMIVKVSERQKGYGGMTLRALKKKCLNKGIEPVAGCWYYNHQSKKTIESAGLYSQTRLLKMTF